MKRAAALFVGLIVFSLSYSQEFSWSNFQECEYDILCLVAHFEGVKANAYWDQHGKLWTIGIGNTVRPDGKKVSASDRIKDEKELLEYFEKHIEINMFPDMEKYLHLEKMNRQEVVALGSMLYNTGSGILRKKDGSPSHFTEVVNRYVDYARDSLNEVDSIAFEECKKELAELINKKVYSGGKKIDQLVIRRSIETKIFFGEIIVDNTGEFALENSVNFAEQPLGAAYSINLKDITDTEVICDSINNCPYGRNLNDSIDYALSHPRPIKAKRPVRRR